MHVVPVSGGGNLAKLVWASCLPLYQGEQVPLIGSPPRLSWISEEELSQRKEKPTTTEQEMSRRPESYGHLQVNKCF